MTDLITLYAFVGWHFTFGCNWRFNIQCMCRYLNLWFLTLNCPWFSKEQWQTWKHSGYPVSNACNCSMAWLAWMIWPFLSGLPFQRDMIIWEFFEHLFLVWMDQLLVVWPKLTYLLALLLLAEPVFFLWLPATMSVQETGISFVSNSGLIKKYSSGS